MNDRSDKPRDPLHLVIIGGGSAATQAAIRAGELGAQITMINDGLPLGGTCVNVGCIPSKFLIRAAEAHHRASKMPYRGIQSSSSLVDFRALIEEKRKLIEELRKSKYEDVLSRIPGFRLIRGHGTILDRKTVEVGGEKLQADHILVATGASPYIPEIPGLEEVGYLTNESLFELDTLPQSLIILGGRFVALETAQIFGRLGSKVTLLQRSERILPQETQDITDPLKEYLSLEGIRIFTGVNLKEVRQNKEEVEVRATVNGKPLTFSATHLLVATGRRGNTDNLGLNRLGIDVDHRGFLRVDETLETKVPGIYGAGDVIGEPMFVYSASYEGALAVENALTEKTRGRHYTALPWVIFTDPQVAGVGLNEEQASSRGIDVDVAVLPISYVPRAIVSKEERGFIKLIRDRSTDKLVGARILAHEGSELLMEISLAIKYGIPVKDIAAFFHPYLTLQEGVKLAALAFHKDIENLSCCAT